MGVRRAGKLLNEPTKQLFPQAPLLLEQPVEEPLGTFEPKQFLLEDKKRTVLCGLQLGKKKLVKLDDKAYRKSSEHIGKFPVVLIAPNDTDVIRGNSENRRKFFFNFFSYFFNF